MLGKRKREVAVVGRQVQESPNNDASDPENHEDVDPDIFRKYFEARFEPLPETQIPIESPRPYQEEEYDDCLDSEESEWDGISGDETADIGVVEIVEHHTVSNIDSDLDKPVSRSFMSSKPPIAEAESRAKRKHQEPSDDDPADSLNLKHDHELQRLLKESHLLQKSQSASKPGSHRHQALDMRLQSLGSKSSLYVQEKMPLSHRKGIVAKAADRESRRRQDARENGVILERVAKARKSTDFKRKDPGIGAPVVGKFRGGTLKLSRKDVHDIQGPSQPGRGSKGRTRR